MFAEEPLTTLFGVEFRRVAPDTWTYASAAPWPQLTPDGTPMMSMIAVGEAAFVQLSAQLDPPGAALEQARAALAGARPPASVTLVSGVAKVRSAEVIVTRGDEPRVVGTSASSGYAPFTAVFAVQATGADRAAFDAAFHGERDHIAIIYDTDTVHGPARITADLARWIRQLKTEE